MKTPLKISLGNCSRVLRAVEAVESTDRMILGSKDLRQTVISIKDWSMTFRSSKGDTTLSFLKR